MILPVLQKLIFFQQGECWLSPKQGGETSAPEQKGVMQWTGTLLRNVVQMLYKLVKSPIVHSKKQENGITLSWSR